MTYLTTRLNGKGFLLNSVKGRTIRKVIKGEWGRGKGEFFNLQELFLTSTASAGFFLGGQVPYTYLFFGGGGNILLPQS